jgi:prepilin-type N-terminal cleavage/methylation domain-containing protein
MQSVHHRGFTLIEILVVMTVIGALLGMSLPGFQRTIVRQSVHGARMAVASRLAVARGTAASRGCPAVMHLVVGADASVWVTSCPTTGAGVDTIGVVEDLSEKFDVTVVANRDSIVFSPTGLAQSTGWFAARFSRAGVTDSIAVSPVGRRIW